ncbi:hypothetical protein like AT3G06040 [Hibiscus trionum]|uniref:Ribosomal protein L7/L12 C-terminal domain-containing protein n=1 Tax=Hibiscus trionum TaxID=183268 RepID=A0A9W7LHI4_HIBTR|nr:hypothetical protein like AT3G06040 [Hibiscus trionum]
MKLVGLVKAICVRPSVREIIGPLQIRTFQHDFVPRDPKTKPKKFKYSQFYYPYGPRPQPSDKIVELAERIAALPPEEHRQIRPTLIERLRLQTMQIIAEKRMGLGAQGRAGASAGAAKIEEKKEKTAFVEKAPVILKQGVTKEEANDIMEKIEAVGGVAVVE